MSNFADSLRNILQTLWVGGLWAIGVLVAPILFAALGDNRALAGLLAGRMFAAIAWVGIVSAIYLLGHTLYRVGFRGMKEGSFWLVAGMLLLTLVNNFAIHPWIAHLKEQAANAARGVFGGGFDTAHALSTLLYLLVCLLGLALVVKGGSAKG